MSHRALRVQEQLRLQICHTTKSSGQAAGPGTKDSMNQLQFLHIPVLSEPVDCFLDSLSCGCLRETQLLNRRRYPRASPWHFTVQSSLDALRAIAHSPTGKPVELCPSGKVRAIEIPALAETSHPRWCRNGRLF